MKLNIKQHLKVFTFTFIHLADAFIQTQFYIQCHFNNTTIIV